MTVTQSESPAPPARAPRVNRIGIEEAAYKGGKSTLCKGCGHDVLLQRASEVVVERLAVWREDEKLTAVLRQLADREVLAARHQVHRAADVGHGAQVDVEELLPRDRPTVWREQDVVGAPRGEQHASVLAVQVDAGQRCVLAFPIDDEDAVPLGMETRSVAAATDKLPLRVTFRLH